MIKRHEQKMGEELAEKLLKIHGPFISGEDLWRSMGFSTAAAFRQAKAQGRLTIPVFALPNRRGTYAFTQHVADWLKNIAEKETASIDKTEK